jgi:hypothetical protein
MGGDGRLSEPSALNEASARCQGQISGSDVARDGGPGFLLPTRNHEVFTWCLKAGLKLVYQMTLMTIGLYNEPNGAYLPSVLY